MEKLTSDDLVLCERDVLVPGFVLLPYIDVSG